MRRSNSNSEKQFNVVQFTELPFAGIDKHVCVLSSWIIYKTDEKVAVAYPNDEDALTIRNRMKNKEKPNDEWRFYVAVIEYESGTIEDAENWIEKQNDDKSCKMENLGKDTRDYQADSMLNRKLRSTKFDKPLASVKRYPRKPLPISIRMPLQLNLKRNMGIKRVKCDAIANAVSGVINHPYAVSEHLKEKQSTIVTDMQLIQSARAGIAAALDDKTCSENILPDIIKGDESVMSDLPASPKLPHKNQTSSAGQIGEQALSAICPKQGLQDVPAGQSKEADVNPRTQLLQLLTTPITVPMPSSTPNQLSQGKYPKLAFLPSTSATHQNLQLRRTNGGSSTEVTHNHQRPHSRGFINNTSSSPYYTINLVNPSDQLLHPSVKKKSSSVTENPAAKRICLGNITDNSLTRQEPTSSTARLNLFDNSVVKQTPRVAQKPPEKDSQKPISNARRDFGSVDLDVPQQGMTSSAAHNLLDLAQRSGSLVGQSHIQHYLLMQKYYLEQIGHSTKYIGHSTYRHAHLPGTMNGEFTLQRKPNSMIQTNQLLPQDLNQYSHLSIGSKQEVMKHKTPTFSREPHTDSAPTTQNFERNFQFPAQNSSNQFYPHFEHSNPRQDPPRYQDLSSHFPKSIANPQKTERQGVIRRTQSPALPKTPIQPLLNAQCGYLLHDPRIQVKLNQNPAEHQILDPVVSGNIVDEVEPITVNAEVQTASLTYRLDETPFALLPGIGIAYQNPRTKKLVVDQATEIDPVMETDHCAAESSDKSAPQVEEIGCQTDAYLVEEQDSSHQETDSQSELSSHDGECEDHRRADTVSESKLTSPQNPQMQQRLVAEQEMLNMFGTLFTQIGASIHCTRDMFNHLRNSIIKCTEIYESLLKKIEEFNEIEQLQISTSLPNDETSGAYERNISESDNAENITDISSASIINHPQGNTFVLPPEYDPNNPKWTRKHQTKQPGLVELIPRSNIYVSKKELKNCKRESKDCRTLARMLLTGVFSKNALSVCSLTGGKAKAFNSLNLDVRPGLDEDARMVLLTFVERYGAKRGWNTDDTSGIISSIRTKIREMRAKYGQVATGPMS